LDAVDERAATEIVEQLEASTAQFAVAQLRVLGGAMARVPVEATAFAHRARRVMVALGAVYERAEETPAHEEWVTRFAAALSDGRPGVYVNFLGDEGEARARMLDGPTRRWLVVHFLVNTPTIVATVDAALAAAVVVLLLQVVEAPRAALVGSGTVAFIVVWGILFAFQLHTLRPLRGKTPRFPSPPDLP
jgi:hypothetical protein